MKSGGRECIAARKLPGSAQHARALRSCIGPRTTLKLFKLVSLVRDRNRRAVGAVPADAEYSGRNVGPIKLASDATDKWPLSPVFPPDFFRCHDRSKCLLLLGLRRTSTCRRGSKWQSPLSTLRSRADSWFPPACSRHSLPNGGRGSQDCLARSRAAAICCFGVVPQVALWMRPVVGRSV